jgi:hypothetical protein
MNPQQIYNGGQAFPHLGYVSTKNLNGMTLRDWFAGQAMAAIIGSLYCTPETTFKEVSGRAYAQADAMIAAREVKP